MDRVELAAFLTDRRARLQPEDVGLVRGARRRTPGLRREEVAVLSHISTEYYVRLEQGRAPRPSAEVLDAVALALRLTTAETDHLHVLAGTTRTRTRTVSRDVRPSVAAMLDRLPHTAAFVLSAAMDVIAWNDLAAALMEDFGERSESDRNLARRVFSTPPSTSTSLPRPDDTAGSALYGIGDETELRQGAAMQLRSARARYPDDTALGDLVDELLAASQDFRRLWERHDIQPPATLTKTFDHPVVGRLVLGCDRLHIEEQDQLVVLYTAVPGSSDERTLRFLDAIGSEAIDSRTS